MEYVAFNLRDIFHEIVNRMELEAAFDHDAYNNFIDEVLEEKIANAELDPDSNIKNYSEALQSMWPEAEALISKSDEAGNSNVDEQELEIPESKPEKEED